MEFVMTGRSMLLASALLAVGGVWAGSASAAPIHADMSLQGSGLVEQVQHRGGGGGGGGHGPSMGGGRSSGGMSVGRSSGGVSGGMSAGRSSGPGMSFGGGGRSNFSGNRQMGGGNFAANSRQSFAATNRPGNWSGNNWNGRRHAGNFRRHRGSSFAFGFGPSYYDYGYDYGYDSGYYPYDDDAYAYVAPGVADGDSVGYCQQRFRSYDPSTGTYLGLDGLRHPCP